MTEHHKKLIHTLRREIKSLENKVIDASAMLWVNGNTWTKIQIDGQKGYIRNMRFEIAEKRRQLTVIALFIFLLGDCDC